jgi:hypothetical protein
MRYPPQSPCACVKRWKSEPRATSRRTSGSAASQCPSCPRVQFERFIVGKSCERACRREREYRAPRARVPRSARQRGVRVGSASPPGRRARSRNSGRSRAEIRAGRRRGRAGPPRAPVSCRFPVRERLRRPRRGRGARTRNSSQIPRGDSSRSSWRRVGASGSRVPRVGMVPASISAPDNDARLAAVAHLMHVLAAEAFCSSASARLRRPRRGRGAHSRNSSRIPRGDASRSSLRSRWRTCRRDRVAARRARPDPAFHVPARCRRRSRAGHYARLAGVACLGR